MFADLNPAYLPTPFALEINKMTTEVQGMLDGIYMIGFIFSAFSLNIMSNICAMYAFIMTFTTALAGGTWRAPMISSYETCYGTWAANL